MKTDDLIRALAADTARKRPIATTLMMGLAPAMLVVVVAVWLVLGFRPDLVAALTSPVSAARIILTGIMGLAGLRIAMLLARPEGRSKARLWPFAVIAMVAAGLWIWAYAATPSDGRQMALVGKTITTCLISIPLLSILPVASVLYAVRDGATTAPAMAGFVAGLAGAGFAAAAYALHCTEDSPMFYVTWYGLAIAFVTAASTLIGARILRW